MKKIWLIISFSLTVLAFSFYYSYTSHINDFVNTAKSKQAIINEYITISSSFIEEMTLYCHELYQRDHIEDSSLFRYLRYNAASNTYSLDAVAGTTEQNKTGNLTGIGAIPESGPIHDEINMALEYNKYFVSLQNQLPETIWIYYTSENGFIDMYPFTSSTEFSYTDDLKNSEYYQVATPANDPKQIPVWTPVYYDRAGKGLLVTLSSPIYNEGAFKGVVSIDISTDELCEIISSDYESYIVDVNDRLIAASDTVNPEQIEMQMDDSYESAPIEGDKPKHTTETIQHKGGYCSYSVGFDKTPWIMTFRVPIWLLILKSSFFSIPILGICLLLAFFVFEVERRKKTEEQLTSSLETLKTYQIRLEAAIRSDFLTSAYNRLGLKERFIKFQSANKETKSPLSIILCDIDYFKKMNDTFGHGAGDRVLIEIANRMKACITDQDLICRWGGEEFVVMLADKPVREAVLIAERIRKDIESMCIPWENDAELKATMTFGVAEYNYKESLEKTISKADQAMYIGKEKGRNRVVAWTDNMK